LYPDLIAAAKADLAGSAVKVASVATAFPSGRASLAVKLQDTKDAVAAGADEIDMVIDRGAFLAGHYLAVYDEIVAIKDASGPAHLKVILETGELATYDNLRRASWVAILAGHSLAVYDEIVAIKDASGPAHLKVILETGELATYDNVRRASWLAMLAGADFIKTSTGKIQPAATLPVTLIMLEAVRDFHDTTGTMIGVKPAGGIRTSKDAIRYLVLVNE